MTPATMRQARDANDGEGYWMIVFAAMLLGLVGIFNLIDGIAAIASSHIFIANAHYVIGDLRAWGWVALILGVLQVLAAIGVLAGNQAARWFAVAVIGLNAIGQMFFSPGYPFWSLMIIAVDVVALWGLCAYGSRETAPLSRDILPNEPPGVDVAANVHPRGALDLVLRSRLACRGFCARAFRRRGLDRPARDEDAEDQADEREHEHHRESHGEGPALRHHPLDDPPKGG